MNTQLKLDNYFSRRECGMPPSYLAAMVVIDSRRSSAPLVKQGSGNYLLRTSGRSDTTDITFMGFDLVVETDYLGDIADVTNAKDGTDCKCMFSDWALAEIKMLAHAEQLARSAE